MALWLEVFSGVMCSPEATNVAVDTILCPSTSTALVWADDALGTLSGL